MAAAVVDAAGAVVFRPGREVLLVHRPKYDDWSFPKGKLDPGEHAVAAAVREVLEETGVRVRLGAPLTAQRYLLANGNTKHVQYWVARAVGDDDVASYQPNAEIDAVAWVPYEEALERLDYDHDRETLREAYDRRRKTYALVVLRHAEAERRDAWSGDDRRRPLTGRGRDQAGALVPLLEAFAPARVLSSSSTRCVQTVLPFAERSAVDLELADWLTEEGATPDVLADRVGDLAALVAEAGGGVLCTHRPVLPLVFEALGQPARPLEPGEMLVLHLRHGEAAATEQHSP